MAADALYPKREEFLRLAPTASFAAAGVSGGTNRKKAADGIRTHNVYLGKVALYH